MRNLICYQLVGMNIVKAEHLGLGDITPANAMTDPLERLGDLLREMKASDSTLTALEEARRYYCGLTRWTFPDKRFSGRLFETLRTWVAERFGPDGTWVFDLGNLTSLYRGLAESPAFSGSSFFKRSIHLRGFRELHESPSLSLSEEAARALRALAEMQGTPILTRQRDEVLDLFSPLMREFGLD
jgi:hypothetical protein